MDTYGVGKAIAGTLLKGDKYFWTKIPNTQKGWVALRDAFKK